MERRCPMVDPRDTVVMVLEDAQKGDVLQTPVGEVTLLEDVEFAHKVSCRPMKKGEPVIKYGEEIGYMLADAPVGTWIHMHNMGCDRGRKKEG